MGDKAEVAYYKSRFADDSHGSDITSNAIEWILDNVQTVVERKRMENLAIPLATDVAMVKIRRLMAWAVLSHDGEISDTKPLEHLTPDNEPTPLIVDSWARGMVPTKQVKAEDTMYRTLDSTGGLGNNSPRSATGSRVSSNTGTSRSGTSRGGTNRTSRTGGSRIGSAGGTKLMDEDDDPTGQIFDLEDEYEGDSLQHAGGMSLDQLLKKQAKNHINEEAEVIEKTEYELMQSSIDEQVKSLKGKKYTIDRDGQVIPLAPVKPTTLPPYQVNPDTKIGNYKEKQSRAGSRNGRSATAQGQAQTADSLQAETPGSLAEAKEKAEKGGDGKGKRKIRVAGSRAVDEYTFLPSYTLADTLSMTAEQVVPTNGVSVQINDATRYGPGVPSIPGKMSRKEYAARNTDGGETMVGGLNEGDETFNGGSSLLQGEDGFDDSQVPLSMQGGTGTSSGAPPMRQELQYKIPDIDVLQGGRPKFVPQLSSPTAKDADAEDGLGPVSNNSGVDVQLAIRPGEKDPKVRLYSHDTTHTGKPKDRDLPQNMKPPSQRTKPNAPPPGQVSKYDSPDKFALARQQQGLPARDTLGNDGLNSPGSHVSNGTAQSGGNASLMKGSSGKVGTMRKKDGFIKKEKPHVAAQLF